MNKTVWVLSHLASSPGTKITLELMRAAGLNPIHVAPHSLHLLMGEGGRGLSYAPELPEPALVYTRLGSSAPVGSLDVVRHLELMGYKVVNGSASLALCRDKFRSYQLMAAHGVPLPSTVYVGPEADYEALKAKVGEPPYVVKLPVGTKGTAVSIVDSARSLRSTLDLLSGLGERVLVQRFIQEAAGTDVRVMVFGGQALLAVRRRASGDEFRSNIHLGGSDSAEVLTPEVARLAEQAARIHGLEVAGVDILEGASGPLVAEVNGSPGLVGPNKQHGELLQRVFREFVWSQLERGGE